MRAHESWEPDAGHRHGRDSPEFGRVANLSDAVYAIAMTLLVLTLEAPDVPPAQLADALIERLPQLAAVTLSFALVANLWWAHHKFVSLLAATEPGLMAINLVVLGAVALVPFPTSLIGSSPTARAAVVPFIGLFTLLVLLHFLLVVRAHAAGVWRRPMPQGLYGWIVTGWLANLALLLLALVVAVWLPIVGLVVAGVSGVTVGATMAVLAPPDYSRWA